MKTATKSCMIDVLLFGPDWIFTEASVLGKNSDSYEAILNMSMFFWLSLYWCTVGYSGQDAKECWKFISG